MNHHLLQFNSIDRYVTVVHILHMLDDRSSSRELVVQSYLINRIVQFCHVIVYENGMLGDHSYLFIPE